MAVTEESLMAFADGELSPTEAAAVESAIAADPDLAQKVEAHRGMRAAVSGAYGGVLDEPMPERLLAAVRGSDASVIDLAAERGARERSRSGWSWRNAAAMAACVVLGLAAGVELRPPPSLIQPSPIGLVARGALADALEDQLASQGPRAGEPVRVAVSFHDARGDYCRTFQTTGGGSMAGVACKDAKAWRVLLAVSAQAAAEPAGGYREASSKMPAAIADEVDRTIAGAPLDARAEALARSRHWR